MQFNHIELQGEHVRLLTLAVHHAPELYEASRYPGIWDYLPQRVNSREDMDRFIAEALRNEAAGEDMPFAIQDVATGRLVGSTRYCDIQPAHRNLEIGWTWLTPEVWRTPINTECKFLLLRHAFETLGVIRVCLKTDGRNLRSQQAIERIGGVREGTLRQHRILPDGYIRDSVYFSILDREWPAIKTRFATLLRRSE